MRSKSFLMVIAAALSMGATSCAGLSNAGRMADWFVNDYAGGRSGRSNNFTLTVVADGHGAYQMAVEAVGRNGSARSYVSSDGRICTLELPSGEYSIRLKVGDVTYATKSVNLDSDKTIYLSF